MNKVGFASEALASSKRMKPLTVSTPAPYIVPAVHFTSSASKSGCSRSCDVSEGVAVPAA